MKLSNTEPQLLEGKLNGRHLMLTVDRGELRLEYAGRDFIAAMSSRVQLQALRNRLAALLEDE